MATTPEDIKAETLPEFPRKWSELMGYEQVEAYLVPIRDALAARTLAGVNSYPPRDAVFQALQSTSPDSTKVVILGQDPYHREGQAHGLAFSVNKETPLPPSLKNIYKELESDVGFSAPDHGFLQAWADQGVLLLNSALTVEQGRPLSHANVGWQDFTDQIIKTLAMKKEHIVFMLWGAYASNKRKLIRANQHLILTAPHPSPLSAYRGFFGCKHFSAANQYLQEHGREPIDWQLDQDQLAIDLFNAEPNR